MKPKQPTEPPRPQQTQLYRPKVRHSHTHQVERNYAKRSGNQKPSSKQASSSTNSEVHLFPLPVVPRPDIPVGGRLTHFVEQWEELTDKKWILSIFPNRFKILLVSSSPIAVPINLIQFPPPPPVIARRDRKSSQETGCGKSTESGNSRFLLPDITSTGFH